MTEEAEVRSGLKNKDRQNRTPEIGRPVLVRKGRGKKVMDLVACILAENKNLKRIYASGFFGGNNRARTYDPLLVRQMLSQLSYASIWSGLRGSNPPPPPWQGGALPNELNPQIKKY